MPLGEILWRSNFAADIAADLQERTITGLCVPFDTPAEVRSPRGTFTERFAPHSFTRTLAERGPGRIRFASGDDHQTLVGRGVVLEERSRGLVGQFKISRTTAGDDCLELARDGVLSGLSVAFRSVPGGDVWSDNGRSVERREVALLHVAACSEPVYSDALITSVRSEMADAIRSDFGRNITDTTMHADELSQRLAAMRAPDIERRAHELTRGLFQ